MDRGAKDQTQGETKDLQGRVERQAGEWTGDREAEAKGAADQAAGKAQKAFGKAKGVTAKVGDKAGEVLGKAGAKLRSKPDKAA